MACSPHLLEPARRKSTWGVMVIFLVSVMGGLAKPNRSRTVLLSLTVSEGLLHGNLPHDRQQNAMTTERLEDESLTSWTNKWGQSKKRP